MMAPLHGVDLARQDPDRPARLGAVVVGTVAGVGVRRSCRQQRRRHHHHRRARHARDSPRPRTACVTTCRPCMNVGCHRPSPTMLRNKGTPWSSGTRWSRGTPWSNGTPLAPPGTPGARGPLDRVDRIEPRQLGNARGVERRIEGAADVTSVGLARRRADAPLHEAEKVRHAAPGIEQDVEAPEVEEVVETGEVQDGIRIADALVGMAQDGHVALHADPRALRKRPFHLGSALRAAVCPVVRHGRQRTDNQRHGRGEQDCAPSHRRPAAPRHCRRRRARLPHPQRRPHLRRSSTPRRRRPLPRPRPPHRRGLLRLPSCAGDALALGSPCPPAPSGSPQRSTSRSSPLREAVASAVPSAPLPSGSCGGSAGGLVVTRRRRSGFDASAR